MISAAETPFELAIIFTTGVQSYPIAQILDPTLVSPITQEEMR